MKNVTVILYPGCIYFEVALACEMLSKKYSIKYFSPNGGMLALSNGLNIETQSFIELSLDSEAVVVPGGEFGSLKDDVVLNQFVIEAHAKKIWLAAICGGPFVLGKAGVLKNKKFAHGFEATQIEFLKTFFEDAFFTDADFVIDENIITAKAQNHIDFAVELAIRLDVADAKYANRTKEYYRGTLGKKIRPLSLAVIENHKKQFLFHRAYDAVKKERFYRPLGGGIDFFEAGEETLKREMLEELNLEVKVSPLLKTFENRFVFESVRGHEIILLYKAEFIDASVYEQRELDIIESGKVIAKAVWMSLEEIKNEGAKLYPQGIEAVLS
jgi:8-oxo-dGTP pyrophosphatase MutT (NUDIX family)